MNYTKFVFHETSWPDILGKTVTIDFNRCELELKTFENVHSCSVSQDERSKFREELALCHTEEWADEYQPPAGVAVLDGYSWSLKLFDGDKLVKESNGHNGFPPALQWKRFIAVLNKGCSLALKKGKEQPNQDLERPCF